MDNKPQIPTLKESQQNKPQLKIKGLATGLSLMERLKQFKKKDLAFILAGLGVLFMAPLAEHFMMAPEGGNGELGAGFGSTRGPGGDMAFGGSKSIAPYETGGGGLAPGGPAGSGSDVITPLNVRDPSALVMGPGATQQAPAVASAPSAPPPPAPAKEESSKWSDALNAGKAAATTAVKKASLPVPKVPLSAGGLRGLGAVSGGSGSSFSLAPISSGGLASGKVNQSNGLTGSSGSGFKGVARGPATGGSASNLDKLKSAASAAGGDFNRAGSAASALESAASRDMGGSGGGGAGEGGSSKDDKATSGSQNKDSKTPGESLEFERLKKEQEKALDLKWKKIEAGDMDLEKFKIRNKMMEDAASALTTPLFKAMGDNMGKRMGCFMSKGTLSDSCQAQDGTLSCNSPTPGGTAVQIPGGSWASSCAGGSASSDGSGSDLNKMQACLQGTDAYLVSNGSPQMSTKIGTGCTSTGKGGPNDSKTKGGVGSSGMTGPQDVPGGTGASLGDECRSIDGLSKPDVAGSGKKTVDPDPTRLAAYAKLKAVGQTLSSVEAWANGTVDNQTACGGTGVGALGVNSDPKKAANARLDATREAQRSIVGGYKGNVASKDTQMIADALAAEAKAYQALSQKLQTLQGDQLTPEAVKAAAEENEKAFAEADGKLKEAMKASDTAYGPLKTGQAFADLETQLNGVKDLLATLKTTADQASRDADAAGKSTKADDVAPHAAQMKGIADNMAKDLSTKLIADQTKQQEAETEFKTTANGGDMLKTHAASLGFYDQKTYDPANAAALTPKAVNVAGSVDGKSDYRAVVKTTLDKLAGDLGQAPFTPPPSEDQKPAVDAQKKTLLETATGTITKADTDVKATNQAIGLQAGKSSGQLQTNIEAKIGGTVAPTTGAPATTAVTPAPSKDVPVGPPEP